MKNILLLAWAAVLALPAFAQDNTGNVWYFGRYAGIDFNGPSPVALTNGALETIEGCSSICDNSGNILFYSDGEDVFNQMHTLMPNGTGLAGGYSSTQSALIVPMPGNATKYYIFTVPQIGGPPGLCYSIVDMTLDNGLGDVIDKNTPVLTNVPLDEKLAGTMHANGQDVWICVHGKQSDTTYAFQVTAAGIDPPVKTKAGTVHTVVEGQMKFSADGSKLAMVSMMQYKLDLFDFNNVTGQLTNAAAYTFPYGAWPYGLEFSPGNSKLYVTCQVDTAGHLCQFDMNAGPNSAVVAGCVSVYDIHTVNYSYEFWSLQVAPDDKIYISFNNRFWIGAIEQPDSLGLLCSVQDSALYLGPYPHECEIGLPNHVTNYQPFVSPLGMNAPPPGATGLVQLLYSAGANTLVIGDMHGASVEIMDASGKRMFRRENAGQLTLDVSSWPEGLYFVATVAEEKRTVQRVIIAH